MNESPRPCPDCGTLLPADSPQALCPACLMHQALASRTLGGDGNPAPATPPWSPEEIADRFPGYEILECLGRGGMGVVYKARQKSLDRMVAIKILPPERVGEEKFSDRFAVEAATLAKLNHPNIVTVHDFGETGGLFYIVMEYVDGVNLRDLLREGKLEPQQALAIVPPVCDALQYAHDKGIVHRDIKPENLLLDKDGRIKIADFGIAKLIENAAPDGGNPGDALPAAATVMAGTQGYSAPEQANGTADHRADIYALGVVLYEMLTGERPGKEIVAPSRKVLLDVRIDEMVLRALEKEPERRYQTAGEFRTVVETIGGTPAIAKPPAIPASSPPRGMIRRWWWLFLVMIPLGLALGLAAGVVLTYIIPKKYEARAIIEVKPPAGVRTGPQFFATEFEKTTSRAVLMKVSDRLELQSRWMQRQDQVMVVLQGLVAVENIRGTDLIVIRVRHTNPEETAEIANMVAGVSRESSPDERIVHEAAVVPRKPSSPKPALLMLIGALAGVMASPLLALVVMVILHRLIPERRHQAAGEFRTLVETMRGTPVPSESPAQLLKAAECLYATPEFHRTIWGAMKIHQGMGSLHLYQDRLEFQAGLSRTVIPLKSVCRLDLIRYPFVHSPAGLRSIEVEFQDGNALRRLVLTPSKGVFSFIGATNSRVIEWFGVIRDAIATATGNPPPGSSTAIPYQGFSGEGTLLAACVTLGSFAVLLGALTFLALTGSWKNLLPMVIPLIFGVSFVLALAWTQRRQRMIELGARPPGGSVSMLGLALKLHGVPLLGIVLALALLVPTYQELFATFDAQLPTAARVVLSLSRFVLHGGWLVVPLLLAVDLLICWLLLKSASRKPFAIWVVIVLLGMIAAAILGGAALSIPIRRLSEELGAVRQDPNSQAVNNAALQREADKLHAELKRRFPDRTTPQGALLAYHEAIDRSDPDAVLASIPSNRMASTVSPQEYARELIAEGKAALVVKEDRATLIAIGEPKPDAEYGIVTLDYQKRIIGANNSVLSSGDRCVREGAEWRVLPRLKEVKPIPATAVAAYREYQVFVGSRQPREMTDPDVQRQMRNLQAKWFELLRGTPAEPILNQMFQADQDKRRAFAKGDDAATLRLTQLLERLERELLAMLVASGVPAPATPVDADRILLEDLALHLIVAIREKDNAKLKSLASDRIKGWPEALPVFAVELREHMRQETGNDRFDLRAGESLVDGDFAAVRCTGPAELDDKCLVLFFVKSADGWRNLSLCNATTATPLAGILADLKKKAATNE